ncbi:hydrogen peroxide-inducible genes activator [Acetobacter sp. AN02]|uniref:hydrogen peroxide-inducible genes activator n=1 Tax=Acetobacter sp. AN02 TaxID=2894186 RepID=UPI0024340E9C|nr:hydrogen peroxide-inducible genes activator [Acetobacter sp. AN02]MDG6093607.1 hydrogen peroxide-inducible genes activator [Acetobacter sp. AN02]
MIALPSPQQLRYLTALAELRHFGRAAELCAVTQSTLSAGILALERQLDARLLDRAAGRRVVFTPLGDEVVRRGRAVLDALESVQGLVQAAREPLTGPVRLGVIPTIGPFLLHRLLPVIRERFPQIRPEVTEDMTERLLEKLHSGRLDVLILAMPCSCDSLETVPLWRDELLLTVPESHDLTEFSRVPAEKITPDTMILPEDGHCLRDQVLDICRERSRTDADAALHSVSSLHSLVRMIGQGMGAGFVPRIAVDAGILDEEPVVVRPVAGGPVWRTISLGWRARSPRAEDFRALAAAFSALAPAENRAGESGEDEVSCTITHADP